MRSTRLPAVDLGQALPIAPCGARRADRDHVLAGYPDPRGRLHDARGGSPPAYLCSRPRPRLRPERVPCLVQRRPTPPRPRTRPCGHRARCRHGARRGQESSNRQEVHPQSSLKADAGAGRARRFRPSPARGAAGGLPRSAPKRPQAHARTGPLTHAGHPSWRTTTVLQPDASARHSGHPRKGIAARPPPLSRLGRRFSGPAGALSGLATGEGAAPKACRPPCRHPIGTAGETWGSACGLRADGQLCFLFQCLALHSRTRKEHDGPSSAGLRVTRNDCWHADC